MSLRVFPLIALALWVSLVMPGFAQPNTNNTTFKAAIMPAGLMVDPSVQVAKTDASEPVPEPIEASQASQTAPLLRIAIVPKDYTDPYDVGAFDPRRGNAQCALKGSYAQCVYQVPSF